MRNPRAGLAALSLLALAGCAGPGADFDARQGASLGPMIGCPEEGAVPLSETVLEVVPASGGEAARYCGRDGTYVLVTRPLVNACFPNGLPCR